MIFNDNGTISYVYRDRVHTAMKRDIEAANTAAEAGIKPGPHPFHAITHEVAFTTWASAGHSATEEMSDALDAWCSWIEDATNDAEEMGDSTTEHARERCGYIFRSDLDDIDAIPDLDDNTCTGHMVAGCTVRGLEVVS